MSLESALNVLQDSGLVRPKTTEQDAEYAFRHGLLQEAAYSLLLKRQRKKLHQQVGLAIERSYPERTEEMAPILAKHFLGGEAGEKALHYLRLAGENARGRFANAEALDYFTSALEVARDLDRPIEQADLRRERGLTYEIMGDFESAQQDFKVCLEFGREHGDQELQLSALLDLGKLWAAKDYEVTGGYFKEALALAREIGNRPMIARSLNRLGNWHINVGNPKKAKDHHREALEIFEAQNDRRGIADTLDFLGMSSMMSSDVKAGAEYYERAIELLRAMEEKQRLASSMTTYALRFYSTMAEAAVGADVEPEVALANFEEALALARELGWKAGESFALWARAFLLNALGELDSAHDLGMDALKLAHDINHTQWMAAANCALSRTYLEKMDLVAALDHAESGWEHANDSGSRLWCGIAIASVAFVHLANGDSEQARNALKKFKDENPGMEMLGDRVYWMAQGEVYFDQGRSQDAVELLDRLIESNPNYEQDETIPRLFRTRGRAHMAQGKLERAREQLEQASAYCVQQKLRLLLWRLHGDLAQLEASEGRAAAAEKQLAAGESVLEKIATNLSDPEERRRFLKQSRQRLSVLASTPSPNPP